MENNLNTENTINGMPTNNTESAHDTQNNDISINETIDAVPFENESVENTVVDVEPSEPLEVITPINEVPNEVPNEESTEESNEENINESSNENPEENSNEEPLNMDDFVQNLNMKMDMMSASLNMMNQNLLIHTNAYDQALQKEINDRTIQWNALSNNLDSLISTIKDFPENCKKHFEFIGGLTILNIIILLINILL